jgi:type I restriction enzyme R subunit
MRQAIEEGFILDVLKNYTTFKRYFKLAKKVENDEEFEKSKAIRVLTAYVDLQAHAIETKVRLMLDHFQDVTIKQIQGKGRAMIVTKSRLHAVRYFIKLRAIMKEKNLGIKPLVAFSGTVKDPDSGEEYTENGLNGLPSRVSISDAFKTPDYRILVVANKFQTGFDEPLLHTMYVDKKLGGVNAVQTLSRLNRTTGGKNNCVVLDFVNEEDKIKDSFQDYYQTTFLENETDPNKLYELQDSLNNFEIFTDEDVKEFAKIFFDKKQPMEKLQPILDRVRSTWKYRDTEEREDFRGVLQSFIRLYGFISQIISFEDADLEKLYVFSQNLNRKLDKRKNTLPMEVMEAVDLDSFRLQQTFEGDISLEKSDAELSGISSNGGGERQPDEIDVLSNIIQSVNEVHGVNLSEEDKVDLEKIKEKLESDDGLKAVAGADNTRENIRMKFDQVFDGLLLDFVNTKLDLYTKLSEPKANQLFKNAMFDDFYDKQRKVS